MNDADRNNTMRLELGTDGVAISCMEPNYVCSCSREETYRKSGSNLAEITAGQIKVSVVTAISGLVVSTIFSLTLIAIWAWHSFHGNVMPDVPWFIISIVMVPFGSAIVMKIPKKVAYRIEDVD